MLKRTFVGLLWVIIPGALVLGIVELQLRIECKTIPATYGYTPDFCKE